MPPLKPMFSYYGSKWRAARQYGRPLTDTVCEPFAGSAAYSLYHRAERAVLIDANPKIVGVWDYLIRATEREIERLPVDFGSTDELRIPNEAKWLIGFWLKKASAEPGKSRTTWGRQYRASGDCKVWGEAARSRIASQLYAIRKWRVFQGDYRSAPDIEADWFIDPPYSNAAGRHYPFNGIDYTVLGRWCRARRGNVIVAENKGATWLPFVDIGVFRGTYGRKRTGASHEVAFRQILFYSGVFS